MSTIKLQQFSLITKFISNYNSSNSRYFYFHGNDVVRLVEIVDGEAVCMTSDDLAANNHKMHGVKFSDIRWYYKDFISEEEFERVWKGEDE